MNNKTGPMTYDEARAAVVATANHGHDPKAVIDRFEKLCADNVPPGEAAGRVLYGPTVDPKTAR